MTGITTIQRATRWLRNRLAPGALILLYHRVVDLPSDPHRLCVTPSHFLEHLQVLRQHGRLMRLRQLDQALRGGNVPPRAVVVTFDDGYADNLHNAKPLLERHDIPATVFVTTGYPGHEREFWWDELGRLFLQPGTLPARLRLSVNGKSCEWELGEASQYSPQAYWRDRGWNVRQKEDPGPRQHVFRSLFRLLQPLAEGERRHVLDEVLEWAGANTTVRPTHRVLSPAEVVTLGEGELLEIGAHTVSHPQLSALPAMLQRDEIRRSKSYLEEILGYPVTSFAYPHGSRTDETVALVREAGYARACASLGNVVRRRTDRFQLPRVEVRDWDGETFARRLRNWFQR